jgi:hypothetical protein
MVSPDAAARWIRIPTENCRCDDLNGDASANTLSAQENKTASRWAKGYARGRSVPPLRGLSPLLYSPRPPPPATPFSQPRSMPLCAP